MIGLQDQLMRDRRTAARLFSCTFEILSLWFFINEQLEKSPGNIKPAILDIDITLLRDQGASLKHQFRLQSCLC